MKISIAKILKIKKHDGVSFFHQIHFKVEFDKNKTSLDCKRSGQFARTAHNSGIKPLENHKNCDTYSFHVEKEEDIKSAVCTIKSLFEEASAWEDDRFQEIDPAQYNEILNPTPF